MTDNSFMVSSCFFKLVIPRPLAHGFDSNSLVKAVSLVDMDMNVDKLSRIHHVRGAGVLVCLTRREAGLTGAFSSTVMGWEGPSYQGPSLRRYKNL